MVCAGEESKTSAGELRGGVPCSLPMLRDFPCCRKAVASGAAFYPGPADLEFYRAQSECVFPSNHAMNGAAVAFQLLRDRMPGCRWMACLAGLLAFSRLFAGMHYPSDILGGGAIAAAVHGVLNKLFAVTFIKKLTGALSLLSDSILYIGKSR